MSSEFYELVVTQFMSDSGLDQETCDFVLRTYVTQSKELLKELRNALYHNDLKHASELLHRLKGSSGNVRANRIMALALTAEEEIIKGNIHEVVAALPVLEDLVGHLESALF
jgi:HPt (histidine-containing phosphotransfer) domain-containing protein